MKSSSPFTRLSRPESAHRLVSLPQRLPVLAALPLMLGAMLFISIHTAGSATFPVRNLNDSGVGSLRYAITNANAAVGTNTRKGVRP
jgi:hypothetical protein